MSLNILKISNSNPDRATLKRAADILRNKGIVVAPTETRYALLVRIDRNDAVRKVFDLKKRELSSATAIFVRDHKDISEFGYETAISIRLVRKFTPGPLTIILRAKKRYSEPITVENKIGIRYSSSPVIAGLLEAVDFNLTATSANISGSEEPETIAAITDLFDSGVDLYLDGGRLDGLSSTVIDCSVEGYEIIRSGSIIENSIIKSLEMN